MALTRSGTLPLIVPILSRPLLHQPGWLSPSTSPTLYFTNSPRHLLPSHTPLTLVKLHWPMAVTLCLLALLAVGAMRMHACMHAMFSESMDDAMGLRHFI